MKSHLIACLGLFLAAVLPASAQEAAPEAAAPAQPKTFVEALHAAGIKLVTGPATVKLGDTSELKLPAGFLAVERDSLEKFYQFTQNSMSGNEVGVVLAPAPADWMLFFDYDPVGYVKDDEKDSLDADKLMKSMTENQDASNAERTKRGWDEIKLAGWASPPHYDTRTNNLKWAFKLTSSADKHQTPWINESIRLLGRGGVTKVTLVANNETFPVDAVAADDFLGAHFAYVSGQRYAEFKAGDKIAEYGLAALVLGGAGAAALKFGFFQKFWKVIVFGAVALFGAIGKLWNKITGKNPAS